MGRRKFDTSQHLERMANATGSETVRHGDRLATTCLTDWTRYLPRPAHRSRWGISVADIRVLQNAREAFPIPNLPPPRTQKATTRLMSPLPSSPLVTPIATSPMDQDSSQEANKENAPAKPPAADPAPEMPQLGPGELPQQIETMLQNIKAHVKNFDTHPPHTIQRLSELVLRPRLHYKALAPYLHAVDRVATVTSSTNIYPLPPAIPDMSSISINGEDASDPAAAVGWANPTNSSLAADEALGGALLTPIPWLNRSSPESNDESSGGSGAQIHSESTETIDGPNGMGSIETVSVSVNGVPSTGHARGVTQGELLRQEQRAGVVPVNQLSRSHDMDAAAANRIAHEEEEDEVIYNESRIADEEDKNEEEEEEEEETPHARGPEEIGAGDIGPQSATTSFVGEGGLDSHDIDVEAAVGRRHDAEGGAAAAKQETAAVATGSETDAAETGAGAGADGGDRDGTEAGDEIDDDASDVSRTLTAESSGTKRGPETDIEGAATSNKKQKDDEDAQGGGTGRGE